MFSDPVSPLPIAPILSGDQLSRLARLRQIPGILQAAPAPSRIEFDGISIPSGAITEISGPAGSGKTEWILRLISSAGAPERSGRHSHQMERIGTVESPWAPGADQGVAHTGVRGSFQRVAWIEDTFSANPRGFSEQGVDLSRFLFVEGGKDSLWATHQILRSGLFSFVVLWARGPLLNTQEPSVELRKLQISAEQARVPLILLSAHPRPTGVNWPLALQIAMDPRSRRPRILDPHSQPPTQDSRHEERHGRRFQRSFYPRRFTA